MLFLNTKRPGHILISRTDAMGDVIMALPLCGLIKKYYPESKISFLGRTYTKSLVAASVHVDQFLNRNDWDNFSADEITAWLREKEIDTVLHLLPAKEVIKACWKAGIKIRIGGKNKFVYWRYCNRIVISKKKKSDLNEAQLNIRLLQALNISEFPERNELPQYYGFSKIPVLTEANKQLLDMNKFNLILHPLSNKNAKEWGLSNFSSLIKLIDKEKFKIFITGSENEKDVLADWIILHKNEVTDLTGALDADQLVAFIAAAGGLIASSTGPVHIAAAAGINTLGLFEDRLKRRGERWGPIGVKASYLQCVNEDMNTIRPDTVYEKIKTWLLKN